MSEFEHIVELIETGRRSANEFLDQGYELLRIVELTKFHKEEGHPGYVNRYVVYIVGRPKGVDQWVPDRWKPDTEAAPAAEASA